MAAARELAGLQTEQRNSNSSDIDQVPTIELCRVINHEDATIADSVAKCIPIIAGAIDILTTRVRAGGRVVYVGAGTSGRLGILDASEIPPTFSAPEGQFIGIIAGGEPAIRHAQEGAEDDVHAAIRDLQALQLDGSLDSLIGIAASGRTPYVLSCLSYAKNLGCATIGVACAEPSEMNTSGNVDFMISPIVGPEVVTGSTRMKAGTATKLVLNMLSTGTMIRTGKAYGNMMVDLKATNFKLRQRSRNILRAICGTKCPTSDDDLDDLLKRCAGSVKLAITVLSLDISVPEAQKRLDEAGGVLANVINNYFDEPLVNGGENQKYLLCVDGGGSKCAALILSADGQTGYGEAPGCNVTDVGVEAAIAAISTAIQHACDTHPTLQSQKWNPTVFSSVWIGLAGHDRKEIAKVVDEALESLFRRPVGQGLMITNDIELLAMSKMSLENAESAVVLVAGTGSVAMSYKRTAEGRCVRVGRTGGWGHLLGDDGSGYYIGRQGIRAALEALDEYRNSSQALENGAVSSSFNPSPLVKRILDHFYPLRAHDVHSIDLLSPPLSAASESEKKKRIAQVARPVLEAADVDPEAQTIISSAVGALVRLLAPITKSGQHETGKSILILAGGLMQNQVFEDALRTALSEAGTSEIFSAVEVVSCPSRTGVEYLLHSR